ncbi:MAG: ABC transporter permease [Myxococcales bacterium]|nr:ABC transporter permease [Myxococcales bacterium]
MLPRLAARLAWSLFTVWAVLTLTFFIFNWLPGDPARVMAGPQARPADVEVIRKQLGLDQPLPVRYGRFVAQLVHFGGDGEAHPNATRLGPISLDLGESYLQRKPVTVLLGRAIGPTLLVGILALAIQVSVGILFGVMAAYRRHTVFDWGAVGLTLIGISAPTFLSGLLLQHVFARWLGWFPLDGYGESDSEILKAAFLPSLTLGLYGAAYYTRLVRDEMITLLGSGYVRTARAKGLSEAVVVFKHALRNALVPLVTVIGMNIGTLVGGAIVTERIFRWPGVGTLTVNAIFDRDGPVVIGVVLLFAVAVVLSNLLVDVSYAALDPRVRSRSR